MCHMTRAIFLYCVIICHDLGLNMCLEGVPCLYGTFAIPPEGLWQSFGSQLSLVWSRQSIRQREPALTYDMTLTRRVIF